MLPIGPTSLTTKLQLLTGVATLAASNSIIISEGTSLWKLVPLKVSRNHYKLAILCHEQSIDLWQKLLCGVIDPASTECPKE